MFGKNVPQIPHVYKSVHWTLFYSVQPPSWLPSCKEDIAMPKVPKLIFIENLAYITTKKVSLTTFIALFPSQKPNKKCTLLCKLGLKGLRV